MKFKKILLFNSLIVWPLFSLFSCQTNTKSSIDNYNLNKELSQNIYKLDNNLWNSSDFKRRKITFSIENNEMFKNKIIPEIQSEEKKNQIINNWNIFSKQFNRIFEKEFINKYHIIYYSNYSSREPIDSVEVKANNVKIHYITYGDNNKSLISGQYLIFIEKRNISNINSISINNISEKSSLTQYNNTLSKVKNKVWFSK